jgi:hypothetical protein
MLGWTLSQSMMLALKSGRIIKTRLRISER